MGCEGIVQRKKQDRYGRRKGSTWTILSNPEGDIPKRGRKLHLKFNAKTYGAVRGLRRGIVANFYPGNSGNDV